MLVLEMFFIGAGAQSGAAQLIAYSEVCLRDSYLHSFETILCMDRFTFRSFLTRKSLSKIRKKLVKTHTHKVLFIGCVSSSDQIEDETARG